MRYLLVALPLLLGPIGPATTAHAQTQISIGISTPGLSIGVNMPSYPQLVRVPGYPVYYAPQADLNYFFYDGLYWVYQGDNWYSSGWYNGPWRMVAPVAVPLYVLRVPVRYYRQPPQYFRGWRSDAPPRWNEHWGRDWEQQRSGWDKWNRRAAPAPAPLPAYQRPYAGPRYPDQTERQQDIRSKNYRYQSREPISQQHFQPPGQVKRQQGDDPGKDNGKGRGKDRKDEKGQK